MSIIQSQVVEVCPSFADSSGLRKWREDWASEGEPPPLYLLASEFVQHLTQLNAAELRDEFASTFELIERLHLSGDNAS